VRPSTEESRKERSVEARIERDEIGRRVSVAVAELVEHIRVRAAVYTRRNVRQVLHVAKAGPRSRNRRRA